MPWGKKEYIEVKDPQDCKDLCDKVMKDELFGFCQVDIEVPDELYEKFNEFSPLFIVDTILKEQIPRHIKEYQEQTGREIIDRTKKLLGIMRAQRIMLYSPLLKWYLSHGLRVTVIHKYLKYESKKPLSWFPKEVAQTRRDADNDPTKKKSGDTSKLKGLSFYGRMVEDLA